MYNSCAVRQEKSWADQFGNVLRKTAPTPSCARQENIGRSQPHRTQYSAEVEGMKPISGSGQLTGYDKPSEDALFDGDLINAGDVADMHPGDIKEIEGGVVVAPLLSKGSIAKAMWERWKKTYEGKTP